MELYGRELPADDIRQHVEDYAGRVRSNDNHRYHALMSLVPEGRQDALDLGCGWGLNSIGMWERGSNVLGTDYSENEIEICRLVWGERDRLRFEQTPVHELENESFDCVMSSQVAEHVHNLGNYLCGINRVLRPDGLLILSVPGGVTPRTVRSLLRRQLEPALRDHSANRVAHYDKTHDHIHSWDQFHLVRLLASVGFLVERYLPADGVPLPGASKRYLYWTRGRLRNLSYTMVFRFRKVCDVTLPQDA